MNTTMIREPQSLFKFQRRFLYLELALALMIASVLIISWCPLLYSRISYGIMLPSTVRAAFSLTATAVVCISLFFFILKEVRKFQIIITDERLIIKNPYRLQTMLFSEMLSVRFIRFPLHHGFLKIRSAGGSVTLPLYIENMEGLVQTIATGLVRYGSIDIFDNKIVSELNIAAKVYGNSYHRGENALFPIILASCFMFAFNCIVGISYWEIDFLYLIVWSSTGIMIPPFVYILSDLIINKSLRKTLFNQVPPQDFQSLLLIVTLVVTLVYLIVGWVFKSVIG